MLIIHAEGKYEQFVRSRRKPSTFCKETLKMKHVKSREFVMNYFSDPHKLVAAIRRHKQVSQPQRDEIFLYDLLAEEAKNLWACCKGSKWMKSGSHMRPAFVLGFCLEGAMIKGNNCSIRGQMTVFFGRISSLFFHTRTRGGDLKNER